MTLWTLDALVEATSGLIHGAPAKNITGISIDSRSVSQGELYIAIQGETHDGHDFALSALEKGAGAALVSHAFAAAHKGNFIAVEDPFKALQDIARAARKRSFAKIIAVTGSVGKTSTKEALKVVFTAMGRTHAAVASFNNHWGVPLTLARMPQETEFGIFEIGMNHAGEITPLVQMVRPHVAIITNVFPVHLAQFKNVEEIAEAKAEIFNGLLEGGTAILNKDNPHFERLAAHAKAFNLLDFGKNHAKILLQAIELKENSSLLEVKVLDEVLRFELSLPGEHLALNCLAVFGAVQALKQNLHVAAAALATLKGVKGRGERFTLPRNITLIDESYNANPASMRAAFKVLETAKGRKIAVLGDMLELGETAVDVHESLARDLEKIDLVFTAGPLMAHLHHALPPEKRGAHAPTSKALLPLLLNALQANDTLMVKGSLGSRMGLVVEGLKALK